MATTRRRILNRDGTFNISRSGGRRRRGADTYHSLLSMGWPRFLAVVVGFYLGVNLAFATAYRLCGPGALENAATVGRSIAFSDAFFFSVQTFATIGYGKLVPSGLAANLLVTLEALCGLLSVALATGLVYARFARPTARVLFSDQAIIGVHDGKPCLLMRMANERSNQIVFAELTVTLIKSETTKEGESYRDLYDLALERHQTPFFTVSWTVVHEIDDKSPLRDLRSREDLERAEAEIMVSMQGIDDTLAQTVHARFSYAPGDIVFGGRFADMLSIREGPRGTVVHMDLDRIHDVVPHESP